MYELIQTGPVSYYIDCPVRMGVYAPGGGDVYLIDSGIDKDAGRRVRQILARQNWRLAAILNTHSNADHIGGNRYLQGQTGCAAYANGIEAAFARHPILEPSFLYGGYPFAELRHKFLLAQDSDVRDLSEPGFPGEIGVIPLPGHFFDMTGFRTPDGVVFLADCLSSRATLDKYGLPFVYDVAAYLETLEKVAAMEAPLFVPAHAEACSDIADLARYNTEKVLEAGEKILALCAEPTAFEEVLKGVFNAYGLNMTFEQYALVGSTVRSYLAWLKDAQRLEGLFMDNRLLWRRTGA